jgi:hypothetical protein
MPRCRVESVLRGNWPAGGCLLAAWALWWSYQPGTARAPAARRRSALADALALRSGLVVPLLTHELRANLAVRIGVILATLRRLPRGDPAPHQRHLDGQRIAVRRGRGDAGAVLAARAAAPDAAHQARIPRRATGFTQRMRLPIYLLPGVLFCAALSLAWSFDRSGHAHVDAAIFCALYLAGVAGTRLGLRITSWFIPFAAMIAVIILGAMT